MKNLIPTAVIAAIVCSCDILQPDMSMGTPRMLTQCSGSNRPFRNQPPELPDAGNITPGGDTTIFITAVCYDDDYDWRRDSAYGSAPARIRLYRNGEQMLEISAGKEHRVSSAPDRHHLIDGHLYTEYCGSGRTTIGMDGNELFSFEGHEFLKGILREGDVLYTLSQNRSGDGFTLRKNGERLESRTHGLLFGDLNDPSYAPQGALYRDRGHLCFAYLVRLGDSYRYYTVQDGKENDLSSYFRSVLDIKVIDGEAKTVLPNDYGFNWTDARIYRDGDAYSVGGDMSSMQKKEPAHTGIYRFRHHPGQEFGFSEGLIYLDGETAHGLDVKQISADNYFFTGRCATASGGRMIIAYNPRERGKRPYVMNGNRKWELDINGYISEVRVEVSPPS